MVTEEQYLNRLIEWIPTDELVEAAETFVDIVEHGFSLEEAFQMTINM